MSNPAPTLNQINAFNATQGTTIDFNIIGGTEVIRSNKIYIYDLSDNSLICTHLYVSTESIHELPANTDSSIVYESGKSSADFTNNTQYYAQIQTFTDVGGTQGGSGLSIAKLFWCLPTPTLTLSTIPTTISTTSYNVSATYTPNTSGGATNEIQEFQFNLYSAIGALLQTSGVVLYGEGVDLSYNFSGLEVDSTYYVTLDVTTTQGMNVSAQSNTFTVSIDTPTMGSASVVNNGCDGYISVTSNLSSEYEHEESSEAGEIMSFTTDSVNDITELDVDFSPVQNGTPWMSAQDTTPYMFRAVPTQTEDFGYESDTIVGGTVGWNQLIEHGNFDATTGWSTAGYGNMTVNNNVGTVTLTDAGTSGRIERSISIKVGHKVLGVANIKPSFSTNLYMTFAGTGAGAYFARIVGATADSWNQISGIRNVVDSDLSSGVIRFYFGGVAGSVGATVQFKDIVLFDLTQMFGTTIADYIYSLEQANAGAGVAWFKKYFPKPYYAYNAGELMSVQASSHDTVGFNAWDEETELGYFDANGTWTSGSWLSSKNPIPVVPNTTYYCNAPDACYVTFWKDAVPAGQSNASLITGSRSDVHGGTFTTPSDCRYIHFNMAGAYGTTYKNDICINISWDGERDGEYEAYVKHSYALDSDLVLRGIPKLDANNKLYYDGDTYASDGTVTRKCIKVTYDGSENWYSVGAGLDANTNRATKDIVIPSQTGYSWDLIGSYVTSTGQAYSAPPLWKADFAPNGALIIGVPSSITTIAEWKAYLAEHPLTLIYKATSTTETADPYTNPQIVDPSGTEEYVGSPIPVGHKTTYQRICPITGWTGCEVTRTGVNLFDVNKIESGVACGSDYFSQGRNAFVISKAGTYTVKANNPSSGYLYARVKNANGSFESFSAIIQSSTYFPVTKTITEGQTLIIFDAVVDTLANTKTKCTNWQIQLELGSTATSYQPYQGTTYTSTFPKYKQQVSQDKIPYITKNIGDTYADTLTENLVGGTIAWNQLVRPNKPTFTYNGVTITNNGDGTFTFSGTANATGSDAICYTILFQQSHKYILLCKGASNDLRFYDGYGADGYDIGNGKIVYWNRASANGYVYFNVTSGITYNVKVTPMLIDLTQMFGTTIADYIYSLEQATEGAGVAWFKQLFPNDYYDYNSGALISVNASAHVIKDANGNVLHTYPLDSDLVLRGIPKLDANNKLYYDGDVYEPDGSVTRKYGIVDLGSLTYNNASNNLFYCNDAIPNFKTVANWRVVANMACARYTVTYGDDTAAGTDKTISAYGVQPRVFIKDTAYNDSTSLKTSLSGVYLVYELATPTTEQADPFEENQAIVPNGIEEYTVTEQGDVEMTVGHDSTYYATKVYGGTIDMASGVLTITHAMTTYDGTESWTWESSNTRAWIGLNAMDRKENYIGSLICDKLPTAIHQASLSSTGITGYQKTSAYQGQNWLYVKVDGVSTASDFTTWLTNNPITVCYELATPIKMLLTPQQMQTLSGQNNIWSNTNGGMYLVYQLPITSLLVKRRDVADVSGKWLTLYSTPITQADDMDFTFIDFLNQYGKTYQYALVPVLAQNQSGIVVQIEGGYTVSDNVDSIFDGVYIADQTNVERVKAGVGYGNIDMNQGVGSITPIGSKYPIVITNSQNQYHNGSIRGTIVPNDFYSNGNLSRIDMVNKRDELEQFLTNKRAKIIKDWNGKMWLVMIMSNVACSFDDNYGMGMVSFSADWLEVGDPTSQQDLYNAGLINVGGV